MVIFLNATVVAGTLGEINNFLYYLGYFLTIKIMSAERPKPPKIESGAEYGTVADFLAYFLHERHQCLDEIPEERVSIEDPKYYLYKCRSNWWTGIMHRLPDLRRFGLVEQDSQISQDIDAFLAFTKTIDFGAFRTKEEIEKANAFLDKLIPYLESKK